MQRRLQWSSPNARRAGNARQIWTSQFEVFARYVNLKSGKVGRAVFKCWQVVQMISWHLRAVRVSFFSPLPNMQDNGRDHVRFCFHRCPPIVCSNCLIASCALSWSRLMACRLSVLSGMALINYLYQFQMKSWVGLQFGWTFKQIIFVGIVLRVPLAVHK